MSDIFLARAIRYLLDALDDQSMVEYALQGNIYSQTIFHSQQICEKSSKACLAILKISIIDKHLYVSQVKQIVVPNSNDLKEKFIILMPLVSRLESYYIVTRYGVDQSGGVHLREYEENEVRMLCNTSIDYLELCFKFIEEKYLIKIPRKRDELKQYFIKYHRDYIKEL